jgi:hypothetical protein
MWDGAAGERIGFELIHYQRLGGGLFWLGLAAVEKSIKVGGAHSLNKLLNLVVITAIVRIDPANLAYAGKVS